MTFFLLMLLAGIALIITLVGYLLTARPQTREPGPRAAYQTDTYVNRPRRRVRQPLELDTSRYLTYVEQRSVSTDNWQSLLPRRILRRRVGEPTPWMGITLVLVSIFLLGIFLLRTIMPNAILIGAMTWPSAPSTSAQPTPLPAGPYTASRDLVRVSQLDPAQYNSNQEYNVWAYSACSAAAMTEVINAYGHRYRVTDILKVESAIGEITPQMGLLEDIGIQRTAARFGFKTAWGHKLALNDVIDIANHGRPVIVSFPPDRYAGGHLLVVVGGDSQNVYLADSSRWNRQSLTHAQFLNWWEGFTAIVTPN